MYINSEAEIVRSFHLCLCVSLSLSLSPCLMSVRGQISSAVDSFLMDFFSLWKKYVYTISSFKFSCACVFASVYVYEIFLSVCIVYIMQKDYNRTSSKCIFLIHCAIQFPCLFEKTSV